MWETFDSVVFLTFLLDFIICICLTYKNYWKFICSKIVGIVPKHLLDFSISFVYVIIKHNHFLHRLQDFHVVSILQLQLVTQNMPLEQGQWNNDQYFTQIQGCLGRTGVCIFSGLQKLDACSWACTYRASKTSISYTKKRAPKINSDVCSTKSS